MADQTSESTEWLEISTTAEPEAVDAVAAVFGEYGKGVSIEHAVESSRDGDVVNLPADAPVLIKTYLPLAHPELNQRKAILEIAIWALGKLRRGTPPRRPPLPAGDRAEPREGEFLLPHLAP